MSAPDLIPVLPESAPFSPEQRAYLNGFFAGLFSRAAAPSSAGESAEPAPTRLPLTILYGSQTGNCEALAKRIAKEASKLAFTPKVHDLASYPISQLAQEQNLLIATSTYGDGEPPDNAKAFWSALSGSNASLLSGTRFAVLALGDSNYPQFCGFGRALDARLEQLGATRICPRQDCDVDFEAAFQTWITAVLAALKSHGYLSRGHPSGMSLPSTTGKDIPLGCPPPRSPAHIGLAEYFPLTATYSRNNPFPARLLVSRPLCAQGSAKDVRHVELSLGNSDLTYEAGDALGVFPTNDAALVEEMLRALNYDGEEAVLGKTGESVPLRLALLSHYEITRIPQPLLVEFAARSRDKTLLSVAAPDANGELTKFLFGREVIDLLLAWPQVKLAPTEFVSLLKKLPPRLYSISASPKEHPHQVHLTVGVVTYESHRRQRRGVCSNFLADPAHRDGPVPVFIQANKAFRPPPPDAPLIMIGPGTGIAPFRAFLQERRATGAQGKNWLFFGDQHAATDFLYRDELESMRQQGLLHRFDTAFSRDQDEKIYVQHRMLEHAAALYAWLEEGASLYVCGDAKRMAQDVDRTLHQVVQTAASKSPDQAADYVLALKAQKRYQRDVY